MAQNGPQDMVRLLTVRRSRGSGPGAAAVPPPGAAAGLLPALKAARMSATEALWSI